MFPAEDLVRIIKGSYPNLKPITVIGRALDIGCGDGRNSIFLRDTGFETHATEVDEKIVNHLLSKHSGIEFKLGHNSKLPYSDSFFDLIVSWHALYYLDSEQGKIQENLTEIRRVLKPGGTLIACIPEITNFIYSDSRLERTDEGGLVQYRKIKDYFNQRTGAVLAAFASSNDFINLLNLYGFKNHDLGYSMGNWFGLQYDWFTSVSY
jgi:SAM-dependent methyltransferase